VRLIKAVTIIETLNKSRRAETHIMKKLITKEEAQKLVAGSEERKQELISMVNSHIEDQAQRGLRWAHLPSGANEVESNWLKEELTLGGFTVKDGNPAVNW